MRCAQLTLLILFSGCVGGCSSQHNTYLPDRTPAGRTMFGVSSMRIHPIFTQVKSWTEQPPGSVGTPRPDGIEALIEFDDQFGDPTKATGTMIFELFNYQRGDPEPRGHRIVNQWIGSLQTLEEQQAHWNRTSRTYSFQLSYPDVSITRSYVLTATFDSPEGRFFDRIVLEGLLPEKKVVPATRPSTRPAANSDITHTGPATRTVEP